MKKEIVILALLAYLTLVYTGSAVECMACHIVPMGAALYPAIDTSLFGNHTNVNRTDGAGNLTSWDCMACHYSASILNIPHNPIVSTYTCEDCHISNISGIVPADRIVHNHIPNGSTNISLTNFSCGDCHNKTSNLFRYSANASASHYGRNASFGISPGEPYCAYCHENSSSVYRDLMQNQTNSMLGNHTSGRVYESHPAGYPNCTTCHWTDTIHGPNLTKPVPNSSFCNSCHNKDTLKKEMHAGKVECKLCHTEVDFDIHNIKYLLQDGTYRSSNATGCGDCHDLDNWPAFKLRFSTANCTTCHLGNGQIRFANAPHLTLPMNHSTNPASGGLWNGSQLAYWDSQNQSSACNYCHGNTLHNTNALGNVSNIKSGNGLNQSITNTSFWCANCHYQGVPSGNYSYNGTSFTREPPEIQNNSGLVPANASDGTSFFNHSLNGYSDAACASCHAVNSPETTASFIHNVGAVEGGTDCISCHQNNMGSFPSINTSLFGIHINVNSTDGAGNLTNLDCIACHYSANTSGFHAVPVLSYTCEDCHISNISGIVPADRMVYNHIPNGSTNISIAGASCGDCHNKTSNLFRYSANASASHYGKNASFGISPGEPYCAYCHENSSSVYRDLMQNQTNSMLGNHTFGRMNPGHRAGYPDCTTCHWTDRIHGTNLTKPVPNSSFCINCHKEDRLQKSMHAGKVECKLCHTEVDSDIHNIKYLLQDGTYRSSNATGCGDCHDLDNWPAFKLRFSTADCTTCHQGNGLIKFEDAPRFPSPLMHSSNPASGRLWNGTQAAYWDSQVNACYYCHGYKLHDTNPLGNISNISAGNALNQSITNTSFWCANCHYNGSTPSGNYSYNATSFSPVPPEMQNKSGFVPATASDGTTFYNHSLAEYSDLACKTCHSPNSSATSALFVHNVGTGGGGPDCISCHDSRGGGAPADKRIDIVSFNLSVHNGLNNGSNGACWACHGNGTVPSGHPPEYKSPKKCSNDACHSLDQKFRAPMIYSHFRNASLIDNPTNAFNSNVTTSNDCQECHANSVNSQGRNINSTVSHFASADLFDSINCIYCHLNEDNSERWGNATLIYKNRTALTELNRENNKFIAREGEYVDLGFDFILKVLEVSSVRNSVLIELRKENVIVDKRLTGIGNYTYEEYLTIDNGSVKVPAIVINVTGIFKGSDGGFIQFEGFRLKRVHSEKKTTSCYSCHVKAMPKAKYRVIERVGGENSKKDEIYYTKEMANFTDNKIFDENVVLKLLGVLTDKDLHVAIQPEKRRSLYEGQVWNISEGTSLVVRGVDTKNENVLLQLQTGDYFYEDIVNRGDIFEFSPTINYLGNQPKNITVFRANVSGIIQAKPKNMVVIEDVFSLSPDIRKINADQRLAGYNASWLWENSTINVGKIPDNFHSPQLYEGRNGGGDCLSCHGKEGFSEKKVLSLGKHNTLNGGGNNACYACHGGMANIQAHPAGYKNPRNCLSCHAATSNNYNAIYIGDEEHKNGKCETCHVSNIHQIIGLHMTPSVKKIVITKENGTTILRATVSAGYKMRVRAARYYIDTLLNKSAMSPADGVFDSQVEDVSARMDLSKLSPGKHVVYVEAMERNNNWGVPSSLEFTIEGGSLMKVPEKKNVSMLTLADTLAILFIAFVLKRFR